MNFLEILAISAVVAVFVGILFAFIVVIFDVDA